MTKVILAAVPLLLCLATAPVLAEQVLYCVDTDVAGFIWDKSGAASLRKFTTSRYIVKMEPATEYGLKQSRVITDTTWGVLGHSLQYKCRANLLGPSDVAGIPDISLSPLVCDEPTGTEPWIFFPSNAYTHAFLRGGPPSSGRDPNIWIAYGICTPF
jgi:hypothetical protein